MTDKLEVFQDMAIHGPIAKRPEVYAALEGYSVDVVLIITWRGAPMISSVMDFSGDSNWVDVTTESPLSRQIEREILAVETMRTI